MRSFALISLLALTVCACGQTTTSKPHTANPPAAQQSQSTAQQPPAKPAPSAPATAQSETEQATGAQESAGDNSEEERTPDRGDVSLERLAALPANAQLPAGRWKAGVNYDPLVPAQPTTAGPGKVEVVEVFWLGCPHCYALEPYVEAWLKRKPAYIDFVRVPVMWGPMHRAHARLFYTLQALNRSDLFEKAFDTIQQQHNLLVAPDEAQTLAVQQAWAKEHGISPEEFAKAYNSFTVNSNLQRAEQLTQRYQVQGVPLVVIDGKYTTDVGKAGSPQNLISLIDDLAAAERKR